MRKISRNKIATPIRLALIFCLVGGLFFGTFFLRTTLASVLWRVVSPVLAHNPLRYVSGQLTSKTTLLSQNEALTAALSSTKATLDDRALLYQENIDLKARMGRDATIHTILSGIIMRPPGVPYDTLIIDAGKAQGVTVGNYVSAGGSMLIGEVDEVYATTARVVLFSAPGESHQALLLQTDARAATPLTVEGQGGGSMVAEVPAHTMVAAGDAVVFPGIVEGMLGKIAHVDSKDGESFEKVYIQLPINPLTLRYVEVVIR